MKKFGFTVAELIIAFGIIGVIASIMLPALRSAQPNREVLMLKKAYSLTARIVSELVNDEDFYPERANNADSGFSNVCISNQLGHEATYHGNTYSGSSKFCGLFAARLNLVGGEPTCTADQTILNGGHFVTTDRIEWQMPISNFSGNDNNGMSYVIIDVNGSRTPNCMRVRITNLQDNAICAEGVGPDRFVIGVDRFGRMHLLDQITIAYLTGDNDTRTYTQVVENLTRRNQWIENEDVSITLPLDNTTCNDN